MSQDEIMTIEEVAKYLKVKPQTVYKWAQEEEIPGTKVGKEWRFRKSILDEWIDTSIILSKSGFDLVYNSSAVAIQKRQLSDNDVEGLLREAME